MVSCPHPEVCVCVFTLQSSSKLSPLFLLAASLLASRGCCIASPFGLSLLYLLHPSLTPLRSVCRGKQTSPPPPPSTLCSHTLPFSLRVFGLPVDLHPHPCSLPLFSPHPKVTTNPVPCLLYITLFFFLLRLSSGESLTFVRACGCGTVQHTHTQTIICHANTEAPTDYSSHFAWLQHGDPHFKSSHHIKRKSLDISHTSPTESRVIEETLQWHGLPDLI